jgi:uncharacterized membrane-anchored protein YhcB (DUF1043 family)
MKSKLIIILACIFGILTGVIALQNNALKNERKEKHRLESNQESLFEAVRKYKVKDSLNAASVERLTLTKRELERHKSDLANTIDALNIKMKRVNATSLTATTTSQTITTPVIDTVFKTNTDTVEVNCIDYYDKWLSFNGCINKDVFTGRFQAYDTIVQVVHRVPKQWWFIKYGTKAIRQEVISKNPHTSIEYTEYIELKK